VSWIVNVKVLSRMRPRNRPGLHDAPIDRMRRDVLLAGHVEPAVFGWNDLQMDVVVGAVDVDVRARVVGNEIATRALECSSRDLRPARPVVEDKQPIGYIPLAFE